MELKNNAVVVGWEEEPQDEAVAGQMAWGYLKLLHENLKNAALFDPTLEPIVGKTPLQTAYNLNQHFLKLFFSGAVEELHTAEREECVESQNDAPSK